MALTQLYTAIGGDTITAARWNNEFGNIYSNGTDVAFPLTKNVSLAGFTVTLDAASVTTLLSTSSVAFSLTPGAKTGTPGTNANLLNIAAATFTDSATAASGTAAMWNALGIRQPTLAATNANVITTKASTLYIENAPAAGTNETLTNAYALYVDAGKAQFDGALQVEGTATFNGAISLQNIVYTFPSSDGKTGTSWRTDGSAVITWASIGPYSGPASVGASSTRTHEGSTTISSNQNISGIHYYTDFTLNEGITLTVDGTGQTKNTVIICARDFITINGTITAAGKGQLGGGGGNPGNAGTAGSDQPGGGGGGDGSAAIGADGGAVIYNGITYQAGGAGGNVGVGTAGTSVTGSYAMELYAGRPLLGGAGGGGGSGGGGAGTGGGTGGGNIVLIAPKITLSNTSAINVSGGAGGAATSGNQGGSGGGGGGRIEMGTSSYTDNGCTFTVTGGAGGAKSGSGGNGGAGADGHRQINIWT